HLLAGLLVVDVVLLQRLDERLHRVARDQPEEEERDRQRAPELDQVEAEPADPVGQQRVGGEQTARTAGPGLVGGSFRGCDRRSRHGSTCPVGSSRPITNMKWPHQFSGTWYRSSSV